MDCRCLQQLFDQHSQDDVNKVVRQESSKRDAIASFSPSGQTSFDDAIVNNNFTESSALRQTLGVESEFGSVGIYG
ncbi:hypothetical protein Q1695_012884 [Nippostrongylus brasiliensis]|nr:hypothetical protein Q1695_012884 [Nippostrongylus brasiliensis]